jgi:thiamine-monophosphate kinase
MTVAGGDIVRSPAALVFHITALGLTRGGRALTRSGAREGDAIAVTGTLGAAAAGVRLLNLPASDLLRRATTADHLIAAQVRPEPQVALGAVLLEYGATAAMDLSDGLLGDLPKILSASNIAARIDTRRIPVAAAVRALFPEEWLELALRGGEDYELLFTAPPGAMSEIAGAATRVGGVVSVIGEVVPANSPDSEIEIVDLEGRSRRVPSGAFDHFGRVDSAS